MQIILHFTSGVNAYIQTFKHLDIQLPKRCPCCGGTKLYKWGKYYRFLVDEEREHCIPIQRFRCAKCCKSGSCLPDFCLSNIQYSTNFVMKLLEYILLYGKVYQQELRTRIRFFKRRFFQNMNAFISFLRELGSIRLPNTPKEKAIKVFGRLSSLHREKRLLTSFFHQTSKHFMAK